MSWVVLLVGLGALLARHRFLIRAARHLTEGGETSSHRRSDVVQAAILLVLMVVFGSLMVTSGAALLPTILFALVTVYFVSLSVER